MIQPPSKQRIDIQPVSSRAQIATVARLAHEIWRQHYLPIIGSAQVEYMLERFQSEQAIQSQVTEGYEYFLACHKEDPVGYVAIAPNPDPASLKLSKLYVLKALRGAGYGGAMLGFLEALCRQRKIPCIWLTVNRENPTVGWYKHMGFTITGTCVQEIGCDFIMDDFRMEKIIYLQDQPADK